MKRAVRAVLVIALLAPAGARAETDACRTFPDQRGDTTSKSIDLASFSISREGSDLVLTYAVAALNAPRPLDADTESYHSSFFVGDEWFTVIAMRHESAWSFWAHPSYGNHLEDESIPLTGFVDPARNAVSVVAPWATFDPSGTRLRRLRDWHVSTQVMKRLHSWRSVGLDGYAYETDTLGGEIAPTLDLDAPCPGWAGATEMCRVVGDATGDQGLESRMKGLHGGLPQGGSSAVDVTALRVGTTDTTLTLELDLTAVAAPLSPGMDAAQYQIDWFVGTDQYWVRATRRPTGWKFQGEQYNVISRAWKVFGSVTAQWIRFDIPLAQVPLLTKGAAVVGADVWSVEGRWVPFTNDDGWFVPSGLEDVAPDSGTGDSWHSPGAPCPPS